MNLYVESSSATGQTISQQGYADLIKAAWILVDIIGRHPQLDFLDSGIRYEVVQLTQVWFSRVGGLNEMLANERLLDDTSRAWEYQGAGASKTELR